MLLLLPQIHQAMAAACRGAFCHSVSDVEEAAWHLVCEVAGASEAEADRAALLELLAPVAMRLPITTPGAPFTKVGSRYQGGGLVTSCWSPVTRGMIIILTPTLRLSLAFLKWPPAGREPGVVC
jgi:hypothetical protein